MRLYIYKLSNQLSVIEGVADWWCERDYRRLIERRVLCTRDESETNFCVREEYESETDYVCELWITLDINMEN